MTWAIQVENLSKKYKIGRGHVQRFDSLYQVLSDTAIAAANKITLGKAAKYLPARIEKRPIEIQSEHLVLSPAQFEGAPEGEFWALRDVSFRVDEGQRVGIIGRNGSGKSTLLKILSRITSPTEGKYSYRGRLISLLEVGTGFHPDLTGRENIHLNAKINGMSDREIRRSFDAIVDFSELGAQIDTPIKRYSSGMYMRLAFSVAAHLQSDILIVDEVLAVGDTGFQKKCMDKMLAIGNSGRTLLFVSHDMDAVRKVCSVAIELAHGRIVSHEDLPKVAGPSEERRGELSAGTGLLSVTTAISDYSFEGGQRGERIWDSLENSQLPSGRVAIRKVSLKRVDGTTSSRFLVGEPIHVAIECIQSLPLEKCDYLLSISLASGRELLTSCGQFDFSGSSGPQVHQLNCSVPPELFNTGAYRISLAMFDPSNDTELCLLRDAVEFEVISESIESKRNLIPWESPLNLKFDWTQQNR